jgi:hypothetical protein
MTASLLINSSSLIRVSNFIVHHKKTGVRFGRIDTSDFWQSEGFGTHGDDILMTCGHGGSNFDFNYYGYCN